MVALYHDNVATEVPLSQPRRSRQEVRVTIGAWLRLRNFMSRKKFLVPRQDFMGFCYDRVFSTVIEFVQDQRVSCCENFFLGHDRVG